MIKDFKTKLPSLWILFFSSWIAEFYAKIWSKMLSAEMEVTKNSSVCCVQVGSSIVMFKVWKYSSKSHSPRLSNNWSHPRTAGELVEPETVRGRS